MYLLAVKIQYSPYTNNKNVTNTDTLTLSILEIKLSLTLYFIVQQCKIFY
jgi:hypothetical protein